MRKAKKRLRKKYISNIANGLRKGEVRAFHLLRAGNELSLMFDRAYLNIFRPWWYDNFDNWGELDFTEEFKKHSEKVAKEIENKTGIDLETFDKVMKSLPRRPKHIRKPKKVKEQPVRQLKNPEEFYIRKHDGSKETVIGEKVFEYKGYDFFVHRAYGHWVVSDKAIGAGITNSSNYKRAVVSAKERIVKHFDKYLELVKKHTA